MSVPAAFITVIVIWTTTPLAIKWGASELGPVTALLLRTFIGIAVGMLIVRIMGIEMPWHKKAVTSYVAGATGFGLGMLLAYIASKSMPSGMISVIFGLSPIVTGLMAAIFTGSRELSAPKLAGLMISIAGLALVFNAELQLDSSKAVPLMLMIISVISFCASGIAVKEINAGLPALSQTMGALIISQPLLILAWFISDEALLTSVSVRAIASTVYLGIGGSILGFMAYFYLLKRVSATAVATATLITPVLALGLGFWLNDETLRSSLLSGAAIILVGLALYVFAPAKAQQTTVNEQQR